MTRGPLGVTQVWGEPPARYAARLLDAHAALDAIDAPFISLQRERFDAKQSALEAAVVPVRAGAAGAHGAAAAGLVFIKNKSHATQKLRPGVPAGAETIQIDPQARRLKRMRTTVDHAIRLAECDLLDLGGGQRFRRLLVTLTYRPGEEWDRCHITRFANAAREWAKRKQFKLRFVWVAELQSRGAVHYHICMWVPRRVLLPKPDKRGWWKFGSSNVTRITGGVHGMSSYVSKYATKLTSQDAYAMPKHARLFGHGGLDCEARRHIRYWQSPYWVRDALTGRADIRRVTGGWADRITGELIESPWRVFLDGGGRTFAVRIERAKAH